MNDLTAQQQLLQLSLRNIMGIDARKPEFQNNLNELALGVWSTFLSDEIVPRLTDEQRDQLFALLETQNTTEQQFTDFLTSAIPEYSQLFEHYSLENKATTVKGRIQQLQLLTEGETEKQELLKKCEKLAGQGQWLELEEVIAVNFSNL